MAIWSRFFGNTAGTAAGFGIGAALGPTLNPITQEVANDMWERYPHVPLSPEALAEAVVRGLVTYNAAAAEAAKSGIDNDPTKNGVDPFDVLYGLAGEPPGSQQLLELWNRGALNEGQVDHGLRQSRMRSEWFEAFKKLRTVLVPVSDLVRMAVREVFDPEQRAALDLDADYPSALTPEAAKLGLSETDARRYWAAHWNLPSYEQLANMRFRGLLTQQQFEDALRAADYAPTWRAKLGEIARAIPSITDFIRFAVREVFDPAQRAALKLDEDYPPEFTAKASLHGMIESDARDYWAAHWQLPSPTQGYQMLWRDEINEAQLDDLLKALDYSPTWRNKLRNIAYHVPGRIDLRRMYAEGLIDYAELVKGYQRLGYNAADSKMLADFAVKLAEKSSTGTGKAFVAKAQTQLWNRTHTSYLAAEITEAEARQRLPQAGVPAGEVDDVLTVWNHERDVERKQLTPAQVKKAWQKAVKNPATGQPWTRDEALAALIGRGYTVNDANTFLDL